MAEHRDPDHHLIAATIRRRLADFGDDYWLACDRDHRFPEEFFAAMAKDGWVGIAVPEEYGGGGRGIAEAAILLREVAASGAALNGCTALHMNVFGLQPVIKFGNHRLKETFLPRAASGELHVAFAVTEPDAGTDTSRISTKAVRDGDNWRISGQKIWTSKALESSVALLLARTSPAPDDEAGRFDGLSLFLVDLDRSHVDIRPIPKAGRNAVATCETFYDDLPVEGWRLVGEQGKGFKHLLSGLNPERVLIAAEAVGIGQAALRRAVDYAKVRRVFDRAIGSNQALSHPLADSYGRLEAAWEMTLIAAARYDAGLSCGAEANIAKYLAADAGYEAADRAVQTHGGLGYAQEYHVERYWRESRIMRLAPVSQEMTLNFIAQQVLGLPRSY
ncbi:acyl-CoA dehydrogenase family protein [Mycobacterium sp. IS-3022]|uniref:acyl-CoA dehydrogenase family protein n=1 Tax=Mycobacterium sp. IS-3022 TaxID=1772277 RepID=UPI0007418063|nr:acyl-CoA dehydrogenase family protein [Mycobacterium sp. IS-3022]KUI01817.1 acyl-CoA dehydrogenase [Mycobacterium sp. IS-3022]